MDVIDNVRHDINDARLSLETAIELLDTIEEKFAGEEVDSLLRDLRSVYGELEQSCERLNRITR